MERRKLIENMGFLLASLGLPGCLREGHCPDPPPEGNIPPEKVEADADETLSEGELRTKISQADFVSHVCYMVKRDKQPPYMDVEYVSDAPREHIKQVADHYSDYVRGGTDLEELRAKVYVPNEGVVPKKVLYTVGTGWAKEHNRGELSKEEYSQRVAETIVAYETS